MTAYVRRLITSAYSGNMLTSSFHAFRGSLCFCDFHHFRRLHAQHLQQRTQKLHFSYSAWLTPPAKMSTRTKAAKPRSARGRVRSSPVAILDTQDSSSSPSFGKGMRRSSRIRSKKSIMDSQSSYESISLPQTSLVQSAAQIPSQPVAGPSRLPVPHIPSTVMEESEVETFQTNVSIGSLPDPSRYTITLAVPPSVSDKLSENDKRDWFVKGEEMIVDAKRGKEKEGMLDRRWGAFGKGKGKQRADDGVVWYGAGMRFPCLCKLRFCIEYQLTKPIARLPPIPQVIHVGKSPSSEHLSHPSGISSQTQPSPTSRCQFT